MRTPGGKQANGVLTSLSHSNLKPSVSEDALEQHPVFLFVFDDQDTVIGLPGRNAYNALAPEFGCDSTGFFDFLQRHFNPKYGPAARSALQAKSAFHQLYECLCDRQA